VHLPTFVNVNVDVNFRQQAAEIIAGIYECEWCGPERLRTLKSEISRVVLLRLSVFRQKEMQINLND